MQQFKQICQWIHRENIPNTIDPDRECSACVLCGKSNDYYSHYIAWGECEKEFIRKHCKSEPDSSSCIHQKEAKCSHPPKCKSHSQWITSVAPAEKEQCIYPSCQEDSKLIAPSFASITDIEAFLDVKSSDDHPLILCTRHYHML